MPSPTPRPAPDEKRSTASGPLTTKDAELAQAERTIEELEATVDTLTTAMFNEGKRRAHEENRALAALGRVTKLEARCDALRRIVVRFRAVLPPGMEPEPGLAKSREVAAALYGQDEADRLFPRKAF